ncbi:hypothetical protein [Adlercreutzia sp. ZJ304]|uniref:hypothetical protein n=1 Tax=Adlercreutzia sp. ZJ304 TaxID=2709791 RepID=UPI0013EB3A30|nr:hypothetical protein [Adlercreutzia sp. ZJ304]
MKESTNVAKAILIPQLRNAKREFLHMHRTPIRKTTQHNQANSLQKQRHPICRQRHTLKVSQIVFRIPKISQHWASEQEVFGETEIGGRDEREL